jgi:hypothetical protein
VITLQIILFCQCLSGRQIPVTYTKLDKDRALNALATSLLLRRDRKSLSPTKRDKVNESSSVDPGDVVVDELLRVLEKDSDYFNNASKLKSEVDGLIEGYISNRNKSEEASKATDDVEKDTLESPLIPCSPIHTNSET